MGHGNIYAVKLCRGPVLYTSTIIAFKAVPYVYDSIGFAIYPKREGHLLLSLLIFYCGEFSHIKSVTKSGRTPLELDALLLLQLPLLFTLQKLLELATNRRCPIKLFSVWFVFQLRNYFIIGLPPSPNKRYLPLDELVDRYKLIDIRTIILNHKLNLSA